MTSTGIGALHSRRITDWLESAPPWVLAAYVIVFSFTTYFSLFAFRKPFAAARLRRLGTA
jgi:hypothetical protein